MIASDNIDKDDFVAFAYFYPFTSLRITVQVYCVAIFYSYPIPINLHHFASFTGIEIYFNPFSYDTVTRFDSHE